ncbi:MAG: RnfABCDGE type electron transport complex subunit D [Rhodocyclaceae bacterium]|jgi:RnfABCDGE-type electron transport complex D subunit|nr:RnfABCDGE type electron transport complex subunit D [Rhodocyclaceae bacterium]
MNDAPLLPLAAAPPVAAPHTYAARSVSTVMAWVMAALTPATVYGFWLYGWPALYLWLITIGCAVGGEAFCLRLMGRRPGPILRDGSAVLTGWLLAVSLPPWAPWWIGAFGGAFAAIFGKQVFGGLGQNPFNPAMVARVALLISFPVAMTSWVAPLPLGSAAAPGVLQSLAITFKGIPTDFDGVASASLLGYSKTEMTRGIDLLHSLAHAGAPGVAWGGFRPGSLGETAALLVAAGGALLLWLRIISWHTPAAMLAGIALPAAIGHALNPGQYLDATTHLLAGGALLGAFFIATDYVTSPNTPAGQLIFGFGVGLLTWVIRTWGGYPEGVAFAVMLMNVMTPVIDRYVKPRAFGRDRRGRPIAARRVN